MTPPSQLDQFLASYDEQIIYNALVLRELVISTLPDITEQIDVSAKMIAYCYGNKYAELICVIIPSKKGLKLGFNRGTSLPDPNGLLKGTGKISRYVEIKKTEDIQDPAVKVLIEEGLKLYREQITK
ncbi:MAG: hypothetical protein A3D31_07465 [Candidatus Fluviicola riflensis]|nr:MAG: hypothetical protein A3D31_07465 [Candidatus Fluviicola riflensis]OGS87218.1 MAG: hypothetical protein A2724_06925 [Fluviicola sp. RIFCSPHIGHO2_01_FULL_43_53]OGS90006.1 MAG: hypothetical protein A3E30_03670 [Fluviicola sp. RIFCSPHIGHO2_12_FULL_43_24]